MNRAVSIYRLFFVAGICLSVITGISAQKRGVIIAKSAPVRVLSDNGRERRAESASDLEKDVFRLINYERLKRGLSPLTWSDRIARIARQHSKNMAQQHFFSHRGKDGSLVSDRASRNGISWMGIGENIVYFQGYDDPAKFAANSWMDSKDHKKNILNKDWQESGIGAFVTDDGSYYLTQVFILPAYGQKASDQPPAKNARFIGSF
jgi:uncharacterized protein YkwD